LKNCVKIRPDLEVPLPDPSWLPAAWGLNPDHLPRAILPTPTLLLQNNLSFSPFLMKVLRENFSEDLFLEKTLYIWNFFWRTRFEHSDRSSTPPNPFCSPTSMIQPHLLAIFFLFVFFFLRKLFKFRQVLDLCEIKMKFGKILGKIWAKVFRFEQIWLDLGKIKILHPQKHSIFYSYLGK